MSRIELRNVPETAAAGSTDPAGDMIVVGLMSGTSLDGVSAAVVRFSRSQPSERVGAELLAFIQKPFPDDIRTRLLAAMTSGSAREYCRLNVDVGHLLADAAVAVMAETDLRREEIAAIASHGLTLWHEPGHSSWQTGDAATIAERTSCRVICDFRSRDIAAGGEGAPLVPIADALLFADPDEWCAFQNIGGIGNITVVPPASSGKQQLAAVRAFDTGPGVILIDDVVRILYPGMQYDLNGDLALKGRVLNDVVAKYLSGSFFRRPPPKSTGRELFTHDFTLRFIADCRDADGCTDEDIVATATAFTAQSIVDQFCRFVPEPVARLYLSGGGARNPALTKAIRAAFAQSAMAADEHKSTAATLLPRAGAPSIDLFDEHFFNGEAKEAVAFAFLGYLTLIGEPGNVPGATGARGARCLGAIVAG